MSITTQPNSPYFDDLNQPDANGLSHLDKNYLRVLFKPGYSVQTRELNQAQSILQAQLDRLGRSLYKANSAIIGGQVSIDNGLRWIDITFADSQALTNFDSLSSDLSQLTLNFSNDSTAKITAVETIAAQIPTRRLFIQSRSGTSQFSGQVTIVPEIGNDLNAQVSASGGAIGCSVESGVYFVKGCMASATSQYVVKAVYNDTDTNISSFSGIAVLKISEKIASATSNSNDANIVEDIVLKDNANGSLNEFAIGADRYKIDLELQLLETLPTSQNESYVKLAQINRGLVTREENSIDASGSTLEKILAERTYEESGNYVIKDFEIEIQNAVGTGFDSKFKSVNDVPSNVAANSDDFFACTLSPSVAYVRGTRVELNNPLTIFGEKARKTQLNIYGKTLPISLNANVGNYIVVNTLTGSGLPVIDNVNAVYTLYNDPTTSNNTTSIGTCKILTIENLGNVGSGVSLRVYLYDITMETSQKFQDAVRIAGSNFSGTGSFNATILEINNIKLNDTGVNNSLFALPYSQIKTVSDISASEKVALNGTKAQDATTITFTLAGKAFDKSASTIVVAVGGVITNSFTIATNTASDTLTLNSLPAGTSVSVIATATVNLENDLGLKQKTTETIALTRIGTSAIYKLNGVYHAIALGSNVTNFSLIDDGQRPNEYVEAQVQFIGTGTAPTTISVTYWKFINNGRYYTADSYRKESAQDSGGKVDIADIPKYQNQRLGDVIDTRLRSNLTDRLALDPYSVISAKVDFYLPRKDLLCVSPDGTFNIIKGKEEIDPISPNIDENISCALYELNIPAYTFSPNDIIKSRINNRRYTMRDIGSLEKRIGNLEYYTTLSLLEKNASDKSVYEDDRERFKNGFVVDGFRNHAIGDINNIDYQCSIDSQRGRLYPFHSDYSVPLKRSDTNPFATISNDTLHLAYSQVPVESLTQPQASQFISLQPHEVVSSAGLMELYPEVDTWSDQTTNPPQTIELFPGLEQSLREIGSSALVSTGIGRRRRFGTGIFGTNWNNWRTTSSTTFRTPPGLSRKGQRLTTVTNQTSTGVVTSLVSDDISNSLGRYISDVSIRPYMRSRAIWIKAEALKPNSTFYFFFDEINVTSYVRNITTDEIFNNAISDLDIDDGLDESALISKYPTSTVTSDENGVVRAVFVVPNNDALKFSSGEKTLRMTNSPRNIEEESTSVADARFISNGLGVTTNETIVSTRLPRIRRTVVTRTRQVVRRFDPVAQTFRVDDETGIFLTGVDLYFATKPIETNKVGVQAYLVSVKNGYPTDDIIPGSESFLSWENINISDNSETATRFNFSQPIYLESDTEYALVVFSESNEYNIYIAQMSGTSRDLLTNTLIVNQPALGVFFTSSNKTTWTAHQNRDLKFVMHRADFTPTGEVELRFKPVIGRHIVDVNTSSFTAVVTGSTNSAWQTTDVTTVVSDPTFPAPSAGGIVAQVAPIYDPVSLAITGFTITKNGFGYVTPPTVTVTNSNNTKSIRFNAILPNYKVSTCNVNQKAINIPGKTNISNRLDLDSTEYNVEIGKPIENIENANHSINYSNADDTELVITLSTTDSRISPIIDVNSLSLQTREYYISNVSGETSTYFTKEISLNNPSDRLDVWLDVNRPTSTSNVKLYANFKDAQNQTIGTEWSEMSIVSANNIAVNSNRDIFSEVRYSINPNVDFVYFTVKIEFIGQNINDIPSCRDLRIIATL